MTAEKREKYRLRGRFITMIVVSLTMVLAFASLLFLISTVLYTSNAREQLEARFREQIASIADTLSLQFENALSHGNILFNERSTILYFHPHYEMTDIERSQLNQVMAEIARSENMLMPYILSECIFFTDDDYVLTQGGSYDKDFYFTRIIEYENYPKEFWDTVPPGARVILGATEATLSQSSTRTVIPVMTTRRKDRSTLVHIANIDARYIRAIISSGELEFAYSLETFDGRTILASDGFDMQDAENASLVYSYTVSDEDLTLTAYISSSSQVDIMRRLMFSNILMITTLCLIGSLLVILLSKRIYSPIRTIKELIPIAGEGSKSEMEGIKDSVAELMTRNDELAAESVSRELLLFFNGIAIPEERISDDINRMGLESGPLAVIAIMTLAENESKNASAAIVLEMQAGSYVSISLDKQLDELILPIADERKDMLALRLKRAMDAFSITALIGVSIITSSNPENLKRAHKEAMQAIPQSSGQKRCEIRFFMDMEKSSRVSFSYYDQKGIANNFTSGNASQLEAFARNIIERNLSRGINASVICEILQQILSIGRNEMEKKGHAADEIPIYQDFMKALSAPHDQKELMLLIDQTISTLRDMQRIAYPDTEIYRNPKIAQIKAYISENYMKPISLDIIADDLSMNPKYLSQLFKSETGKNISDYIAELRIEKAKELLIGTDMRVIEIAEHIGIPSRATFLRVFQKIENITPTEFRNIRKKEK